MYDWTTWTKTWLFSGSVWLHWTVFEVGGWHFSAYDGLSTSNWCIVKISEAHKESKNEHTQTINFLRCMTKKTCKTEESSLKKMSFKVVLFQGSVFNGHNRVSLSVLSTSSTLEKAELKHVHCGSALPGNKNTYFWVLTPLFWKSQMFSVACAWFYPLFGFDSNSERKVQQKQ